MTIIREELLTFGEAAKLIRSNPATIWRWQKYGIPLPCGTRLKLEVVKIGGRMLTSREALERFIAAQNPSRPDDPTSTDTPKPTRASRRGKTAAERAGAELEKLGA